MVQQWEAIEIDIGGRTFGVRPVGSWVLESGNELAQALAVSLDKPYGPFQGFIQRYRQPFAQLVVGL